MKEITGKETHEEAAYSAELPALQDSASDQIKTKHCPEELQAKQEAIEATEGQPAECTQKNLLTDIFLNQLKALCGLYKLYIIHGLSV